MKEPLVVSYSDTIISSSYIVLLYNMFPLGLYSLSCKSTISVMCKCKEYFYVGVGII